MKPFLASATHGGSRRDVGTSPGAHRASPGYFEESQYIRKAVGDRVKSETRGRLPASSVNVSFLYSLGGHGQVTRPGACT